MTLNGVVTAEARYLWLVVFLSRFKPSGNTLPVAVMVLAVIVAVLVAVVRLLLFKLLLLLSLYNCLSGAMHGIEHT